VFRGDSPETKRKLREDKFTLLRYRLSDKFCVTAGRENELITNTILANQYINLKISNDIKIPVAQFLESSSPVESSISLPQICNNWE